MPFLGGINISLDNLMDMTLDERDIVIKVLAEQREQAGELLSTVLKSLRRNL